MEIKVVLRSQRRKNSSQSNVLPLQNPFQQNAQRQNVISSKSLALMYLSVRLRFPFESYPSVPMMSFKKKIYIFRSVR